MDGVIDYKKVIQLMITDGAISQEVIAKYVPELKESEDEKIRKELITHCRNIRCVTEEGAERTAKWIAWLEKQDEQKPQGKSALEAAQEEKVDNQNCVKPNKVEPKFKIGDIIRLKDGDGLEWTVEGVLNNGYYTIVCADRDDFIQLDDKWELIEQKPAWSKKDAKMSRFIGNAITANDASIYLESKIKDAHVWLEKLKDRVQPQPKQEWNEEDERQWNNIWDVLDGRFELSEKGYKNAANWFLNLRKSLRPQNTWKPSDEQMVALESATENCAYSEYQDCLRELIGQLKKLKG